MTGLPRATNALSDERRPAGPVFGLCLQDAVTPRVSIHMSRLRGLAAQGRIGRPGFLLQGAGLHGRPKRPVVMAAPSGPPVRAPSPGSPLARPTQWADLSVGRTHQRPGRLRRKWRLLTCVTMMHS